MGKTPNADTRLTEDEGTFLALLARIQPATAYQLSKAYALSPVSNFGTSKGKIYPIIDRLEARGLVQKSKVGGDSRGTERLECTVNGRNAVRTWAMDIRPTHLLLDDPMRTRVQSFDLLSSAEQIDWIVRCRVQLNEKLRELDVYRRTAEVPFQDIVHDNAVSSVRSRLEWLDRLLAIVATD